MSVPQSDQRVPHRIYRPLAAVSLLVPLLAALVFVQMFAGPLPLTDEWTYTHALREIHDIDWDSDTAWSQFRAAYPTRHSEHLVGVPFVLYAPIVELFNYDSRWIIRLTVGCFTLIGLIVWRRLIPEPERLFPVLLLLLCPSHFMEFLWGWQVTLTLSILFPLAGLAALDQISSAEKPAHVARVVMIGTVLIVLGTFSSAGGFFGFPAAIFLMALKPIRWRRRVWSIAFLGVVAGVIYQLFLSKTSPHEITIGAREFWYVLTALGATLWGSPVGLTEFQFDARSAGGLLIVGSTVALGVRAFVTRATPQVALAMSVVLFGYLCVIPIAIARPYLGNWHLQYALPAVFGAYAFAVRLHRHDTTLWTKIPGMTLGALMMSCLVGYHQGFTQHGPAYREYTKAIEDYTLNHLPYPERRPPYPPQGANRDMDAHLTLFLAAQGNPVFPAPTQIENPYPPDTLIRAFLDEQQVDFPVLLTGLAPPAKILSIILRVDNPPHEMVARIGEELRWLPRVNESFIPDGGHSPDAAYYMALIDPSRHPDDTVIETIAPYQRPQP